MALRINDIEKYIPQAEQYYLDVENYYKDLSFHDAVRNAARAVIPISIR